MVFEDIGRLCVLVVRGPGSDSRRYQIFWVIVDLEKVALHTAKKKYFAA
jgi:hypothetical protein